MPLSDCDILAHREQGHILIHPFNRKQLKNCQYDVRLGNNFYREAKSETGMFNIWSDTQVAKMWQKGETVCRDYLMIKYPNNDFRSLPPNAEVILLEPGETILGHTVEFIGGVSEGIVGQMFCRSSLGRSAITVCKCAGWGDVGYFNRWTMEITNVSNKNIIPLVVGECIAQIVFSRCDTLPSVVYSTDGNYQHGNYLKDDGTVDIEKLESDWTPEDMLSKLPKSKSWK
jgi:dCTP deaminase